MLRIKVIRTQNLSDMTEKELNRTFSVDKSYIDEKDSRVEVLHKICNLYLKNKNKMKNQLKENCIL